MENEIVTFDYTELDVITADKLKKHEVAIKNIQSNAIYKIGEELQAAHDELANHRNGTFFAWCDRLGFKRETVKNILNYHEFIDQNLANKGELENLPKSLIYSAARPSTPQALKDGVAQGDITTLAEFRDMKARLSAAQDAAARSDAARVAAVDAASEAQTKAANMAELLAAEQRGRKEAERSAEQLTRMATSLRATIERQASELANRPERETVVVPDDYETLKRNCESLEKENAELKAHSQGMSVQELAESNPVYAKHGRTHEESAKAAQAVAEALDKIDRLPFNDYEMQEYGRCFLDYSIQREETLAHVQAVIERAQRKFELLADVFSYGPKLKAVK